MDDRVLQFRLGVFVVVVATAVMTLALIFLFGELPQGGQKLHIRVVYLVRHSRTAVLQIAHAAL